jgi:hypothetical protein
MRETRQSGSEGGGGNASPYPYCRGVPGMALILEVQVLYGPASRNR